MKRPGKLKRTSPRRAARGQKAASGRTDPAAVDEFEREGMGVAPKE